MPAKGLGFIVLMAALSIFSAPLGWAADSSHAINSGDEPLIAQLPERVVDQRLYVSGISRAHQALRIYRQGIPEVETRSNESGDFAAAILLQQGRNSIQVVAVDFGRETERSNVEQVEYSPVARAADKSGYTAATGPIVDSLSAPVLDTPTTPATTNPISVTGTATAGATVRFFVNAVQVQSGTVAGNGQFSVHVPLEDGANTIYAIAEDGSGQSPASNTVAVSYTNGVSRTQSGSLAQDTAWTKGDGTPYVITSNLTVPAGVTLWLEPGATLKFAASTKLLVQGSIVVRGTASDNVSLTSNQATPTRGYWAGVEIATTAIMVAVDYGRIEYGTNGLYFHGSGASVGTVTHTLIRNNSKGIYVQAPNAAPTITNGNEVTANQYGLYVLGNNTAAQNPLPIVTGNWIHDNVNAGSTIWDYYTASFGNPASTILNATGNWWGTPDPAVIAVRIFDWTDSIASPTVNYGGYLNAAGGSPVFSGPTLDGPINSNTTLTAQVYQVLGTVEVAAGVTLTIPAGATLKFQSNYVLRIKGSLQVTGTSSQRAVFTSGKTTPASGDWTGIEITSTATNVSIDYAQIEYANYGLYFNGSAAGVGLVTHTLIQNNTRGVYVLAPNASPTLNNGNEITANRYGVYVQGNNTAAQNPLPVVTGNLIHDNVNAGATIWDYYTSSFGNPGSTLLNATGNWWGSTDAAVIAIRIFDWTDSVALPTVNYGGYLDAAGGTPVFAGPTLSGLIIANTTLTAQVYQMLGTVEVAAGVTLTVPAGATLKAQGNYVLRIKGSLQVTGTSSQRVVFTSGRTPPSITDWTGIEITPTATSVSIDYAQIEYATNGLNFNGCAAGVGLVTHTLIQNNTRGINVAAPNASPVIKNGNEIKANRYGIYVDGNGNAAQNPMPTVTGNLIHDNVFGGATIYDYYTTTFGNSSSTVLNATGNWWGTNDYWLIADHIWDHANVTGLPIVGYEGFLDSATQTPPAVVAYGVFISTSEAKPMQNVSAEGTFMLTAPGSVTYKVYRESDDALIVSSTLAYPSAGTYPFSWNGRKKDDTIEPVGLYRVVLEATDGVTTSIYDPPEPLTSGSVSGTIPPTFDPFRNVFWKINVTTAAPGGLVSLQATPNGGTPFDIFDRSYYPPGQSWVYWDGRDPTGQIVTQQTAMYFPPPVLLRASALRVSGTQPVITGNGAVPNIEVKSNPYLITHSYEEISTLVYRIDLDSYVTVKLLPPGIYDPGNAAAIVLVDYELQQASSSGQPIDHVVEWRGYDPQNTNHISTSDEGVFTFTIEATSSESYLSTLYRGVLQIRR
jgi:hypothetical protein